MFGSDVQGIAVIFGVIAGITLFVLAMIFVAVPLFKGIGWSIGAIFKGIGWLIVHVFEFISGTLGDIVRFIGSLMVMIVLLPMVPVNIVIGRWSAAGHFATRFKNELAIGAACVYRAVIRRPLKLVLLDGVLEGLEQRLPDAMAGAPGADTPSRRTGQFEGYSIVGSLKAGGSGAKLYVAEPQANKRRKFANMPDRVVIKAFALTEGSSLPQIVRESRALECAKQLGHVLDHGMDDHRFFYVMPYHPGEHLGVLTRQFHAECGSRGLDRRRLADVMAYTRDLLATLSAYHKGGLWHKDVKPENVIVHDGRAHLVDLGLVTPLRSAMTLTTHGTEYFRDPEMVRQALRGVKVHQVDGAKFDIYAVGAVLYFMIENTFPAHGGLSRVTQSCPEALRWIVRRAMTEYNQRYATADAMLSDLAHVMQARDPFAIKPADLPSMGGVHDVGDSAQAHEHVPAKDHVAAAINAAGAAVASAMSAVGAAIGSANGAEAAAGAAANAAKEATGGANQAAQSAWSGSASHRSHSPKIVVTNWWTGEYRVDDESGNAMHTPGHADARVFRRHAAAFREQSNDWRDQVRAGTMSARKAAKEQIRAARERAREMRSRAMAHRQRINGTHVSASPWLFAIGFVTVGLIVAALVLAFTGVRAMRTHSSGSSMASVVPSSQLRPVLLVVEGGELGNAKVKQRIDRIVAERRRSGYDVVTTLVEDAHLRTLINQWWKDQDGPADEALEQIMEQQNVYGILHVSVTGDSRRPVKNVKEQLVFSTRPDAVSRRRMNVEHLVPTGLAPSAPYVLINDHPAKTDPKVEKVINAAIEAFAKRGWKFEMTDTVEVQVRKLMPTGKLETVGQLPPMLHETLVSNGLGGIVRIEAAPGDAPPEERIVVTVVHANELPALPEAPSTPAPPIAPAPVVEQAETDELIEPQVRAMSCVFIRIAA